MVLTNSKPKTKLILFVSTLALISIPIISLIYSNQPSNAADAKNFNAGRIIDDSVMTNKNSMSEAEIASFLLSRGSCRDYNLAKVGGVRVGDYITLKGSTTTWKWHIKDNHFVCLAEETFDDESAAKIIWQAAQDYNINPQVLIVLLQKEQGLITDSYPQDQQYRTATGYGCPDTADCDSKYFGFKNQIRNSAAFYNAYQTENTAWYKSVWPGDHYTGKWTPFNYDILFHPKAACGTQSTFIENKATASLYSFTPYRPNQAALNAQYGSGDGCSSYGNRNFFLYFTEWFGPTIRESPYFSPMDLSRQLYTKSATAKIDPSNGKKTEDLPAGLLIGFKQKINYNGKVCLRTETDAGLNKQMCVLEENLKELFSNMVAPRKLYTKSATVKIDPSNGKKTEDLPAGLEIDFLQLTDYMNDDLCLRTKTDKNLNKRMCVSYKNLYEVDEVFNPMDTPRQLKARKDTSKINPIALEAVPNQFVLKDQVVKFSSKSTTSDGKLCLRTELNSESNSNMCLVYEDLAEIN